MIRAKKFILLILILINTIILTAQEDMETFSPIPSQLRVFPNGLEMVLTWKDTNDLTDELYAIYRSSQPIDEPYIDNNSPIALVESGIMIYTDTPEQSGDIYYAIICRDALRDYPIVMPYRNSLSRPVYLDNRDYQAERAAVIENLQWEIIDQHVALSFESSQSNRSYGIYRSTSPINVLSDIDNSTLLRLLEPGQEYYLDSPIPGIPYYYAVVDYQLLQSRDDGVLYANNTLVEPVRLPLNQYLKDQYWDVPQRRAPLPDIRLDRYFQELPEANLMLPSRVPMEPELEIRLDEILTPYRIEGMVEPVIDILSTEKGDTENTTQLKLNEIINSGSFSQKEWEKAYEAIINLLPLVEDSLFNARIYYYCGQCSYFSGNYEEAYLNFTLSSIYYPRESSEWMNVIIEKL